MAKVIFLTDLRTKEAYTMNNMKSLVIVTILGIGGLVGLYIGLQAIYYMTPSVRATNNYHLIWTENSDASTSSFPSKVQLQPAKSALQ